MSEKPAQISEVAVLSRRALGTAAPFISSRSYQSSQPRKNWAFLSWIKSVSANRSNVVLMFSLTYGETR